MSDRRRKPRKAEQALIDSAVSPVFVKASPHLHAIEAIVAEDLVTTVPQDLVHFAVRDFMNLFGNEIFGQAELDQLAVGG